MSIIFIGTPEFAVPSLRHLSESGYRISAVVTQPDRPAGRGRTTRATPVKEAALELGLAVLQPTTLRDEAEIERISALHPEAMVAVAYGQILRPDFLAIAPRGVVNVHPSLLPRYRGASPIQSAILSGDDITGVTIMLMDAGMDSGPVLAQQEAAIVADDTGGSLSEKLADVGARVLTVTLRDWLDGSLQPQPQDESKATVTRLLSKDDGLIDWSESAVQISRQVRAFDPWPGSYTTLGGEKLIIWRALPVDDDGSSTPGEVAELARGTTDVRIAVGTGDGMLELVDVQREGRNRVSAADFARGTRNLVGSRVG
jgi:methionyl-tRNA formyltransferase